MLCTSLVAVVPKDDATVIHRDFRCRWNPFVPIRAGAYAGYGDTTCGGPILGCVGFVRCSPDSKSDQRRRPNPRAPTDFRSLFIHGHNLAGLSSIIRTSSRQAFVIILCSRMYFLNAPFEGLDRADEGNGPGSPWPSKHRPVACPSLKYRFMIRLPRSNEPERSGKLGEPASPSTRVSRSKVPRKRRQQQPAIVGHRR
jgi:hypothetical protein